MKHLALLSFFFSIAFNIKAQSVPDSSFEVWDTVSNYTEPQGWSTSNEQTGSLNGFGVVRSNDAHSGSYAALVRTVRIGLSPGTPYAGVLTNGTFINSGTQFVGGSPFSYLPDSMFIYYKYTAPAFDSAWIVVNFLHHNAQGGRDTVGYIDTLVGNAVNYTRGAFPIIKHDSIHNVTDSVLIIILSCRDPLLPDSGQLLIDDISFGGIYSGITEVKHETVSIDIFPNPANHNITLQVNNGRPLITSAAIYTVDGKKMLYAESREITAQLKLNTAALAPGDYIVSIALADGTSARQLINITR